MKRTRALSWGFATLFPSVLCLAGIADPVTILVAEDESVISGRPDINYSQSTYRGGLFSGVDGGVSGAAHFYLKFELPDFDSSLRLRSAILSGCYVDDFHGGDQAVHEISYVGSDDWSENTITWDNQPGPSVGSPEATFDPTASPLGEWTTWDITQLAKQEYAGDGFLSLQFRSMSESVTPDNLSWVYFAEKEYDPEKGFRIALTFIPLPRAIWSGLTLLGVLGATTVMKRFRASSRDAQ